MWRLLTQVRYEEVPVFRQLLRGNEQYTKWKVLRSNQHNECRVVSTPWLLTIVCSRWPPWFSMSCCLNFCNKTPLLVPVLFNITQNGYLSIMQATSCDVYLFGVTRPHLQPRDYRGTLVILEHVANIFGYATAKSEAKGMECVVPTGRCNGQLGKAKHVIFLGEW
jgi:hypothetical protein